MVKIFLYYFVQNVSGETIKEPNIFALPKDYPETSKITAKEIYDTFPVKFWNCYLRFFLDDKNQNLKVWLDLPPSATVPVYKDKIYVKVLKLPENVKIGFKNDEIFHKKAQNSSHKKAMSKEKKPVKEQAKIGNSNIMDKNAKIDFDNIASNLNFKDENKTQFTNKKINPNTDQPQKSKPKTNNTQNNGDVFNVFSDMFSSSSSNPNIPTPMQNNENPSTINNNNIFSEIFTNNKNNMSTKNSTGPQIKKPNQSSNSKGSFDLHGLGLSFNPNDSNSQANNFNSTGNSNTKPVNISNNPIDRVDSTFLNEEQIQDEIDRIVNNWMLNQEGIMKNLMMMLASLHEVWTEDPSFKNISLREMIDDDKQIKRNFRKAMIQLHHDKNSGKEFKIQYLSDKLFHLITKANEEFDNK